MLTLSTCVYLPNSVLLGSAVFVPSDIEWGRLKGLDERTHIRGVQWEWESGIPMGPMESHGNGNELTMEMEMGREWELIEWE